MRVVLLEVAFECLEVGVGDLPRHVVMDGLLDVLVLLCFGLFAQSEVAELDVPSGIDEHVVRLDIPMNVVLLVDALDGQHDLCCEKLGLPLL